MYWLIHFEFLSFSFLFENTMACKKYVNNEQLDKTLNERQIK